MAWCHGGEGTCGDNLLVSKEGRGSRGHGEAGKEGCGEVGGEGRRRDGEDIQGYGYFAGEWGKEAAGGVWGGCGGGVVKKA